MEDYLKIISTVCYIRSNGKVLMLYRNKLDSHSHKRSFRGLGGKSENGDFQHPLRREEIDEKLVEDDKGILRTKTGFAFLWQTEVSLMYRKGGVGGRFTC